MQVNEPFKEKGTSKIEDITEHLSFRLALEKDINSVYRLMKERNPEMDREKLRLRTKKEIRELNDGKNYGLFVAELSSSVIGFCRFYHSESVPKGKIKYNSPSGYYGMGIIVEKSFRRKGVARFLSIKRFEWLKELGAKTIYSCVALENKTSQNMHKEFGFEEIGRIPGALTVTFDAGEGLLYKKKLEFSDES